MDQAKHTPTPWTVGGKYAYKSVLMNARGESIASGGNNRQVQGAELQASLLHAAHCVNVHDELVAALSDLLREIRIVGGRMPDGFDWTAVRNAEISASHALAKAGVLT